MKTTARMTISAGLLTRGTVRREVERYLFMHGLDHDIHEDKSWVGSEFYITVRGEENVLRMAIADIRDWCNQIDDS